MENELNINEVKHHFKNITDNMYYENNDKLAQKSKDLNTQFKKMLGEMVENNNKLVLNIKGNKWAKQGHKILNKSIWYNIYSVKFGLNYPIIINVSIDKNGLNCFIDIYENRIKSDKNLIKKLSSILRKELNKKLQENNNDFGFFKIENIDEFEEKFKKIVEIYLDIIPKVNQNIFNKLIELYNKSTSSIHCKIKETDEHYQLRKNLKKLVDKFLENPTEENFKEFWNRKVINSVQQASNATNILNKYNDINKLKENIKNLIELENPNEEKIIMQIKNSKNSSLEFYYYYHMKDDKFPLINGGIKNALRIIEDNNVVIEKNSTIEKMENLKEKIGDKNNLEKFYLLDQFLNLIDKIKYEDIEKEKNNQKLYEYAYLFTYFRTQHKTNYTNEFYELLQKSKNIIFYGAPGTGKTYLTEENIENIIEIDYINDIIENNENNRFLKLQFHPSYTYDDFIEGLKPVLVGKEFFLKLQEGEFKKFCNTALKYQDNYEKANKEDKLKWGFFVLIDEINRAELSRVFGEVMYAIEKRGKSIQTQYSYLKEENDNFIIPTNLFIIGTMNDIDRSIDSFDLALRRRFTWIRKDCDYDVINYHFNDDKNIDNYLTACQNLNDYISETLNLGKSYELGHSYFMKIENINDTQIDNLWEEHISPLLKEYLRSEFDEKEIEEKLKQTKKRFTLK